MSEETNKTEITNSLSGLDLDAIMSLGKTQSRVPVEKAPETITQESQVSQTKEVLSKNTSASQTAALLDDMKSKSAVTKPDDVDDSIEEDEQTIVAGTNGDLDDEEQEQTTQTGDDSPVKIWAETLREQGHIDYKDEEFQDNPEFVVSLYEKAREADRQAYRDSLPPQIKELIENYEEGVPLDQLIARESRLVEYSSIDPDVLGDSDPQAQELCKALIYDAGIAEGKSPEEIQEEIDDYTSSGLLPKQGRRSLNKLIQIEETQKQKEINDAKEAKRIQKEAAQAQITKTKEKIESLTEVIPGFSITESQKKELFQNLTKIGNDNKTAFKRAVESDPDFMIKAAYLATILKWDFKPVERKAATNVTKRIAQAVKTYKPSSNKDVDFGVLRKAGEFGS